MVVLDNNEYPNALNYPEVSFPAPQAAPNVEPDDPSTEILIAYSSEWTAVLLAAALSLKQYSTWQGSHDEQITAVNRVELLLIQLQNPVAIPPTGEYPAPFWDAGTTEDDQAPAETQEWYGRVTDAAAPPGELTFQQDAVIWLLTGFVALSATPAAAIFFRSVAPRFVLAFDRGDVREVWRIVIDATDYDVVDTDDITPGAIRELAVDGLVDNPTHDILIVKVP
jgi:hypothetical protein